MSEEWDEETGTVYSGIWHGITLAEVRKAYFRTISDSLYTIQKLIDQDETVNFTFDTASSGAAIVDDYYLTWEMIAPDDYNVELGETVEDMFTNLENAVSNNPVPTWEDIAKYLNEKRSTINEDLVEGTIATITDAYGNTYPGTAHQLPAINSFVDVIRWFKTWMSNTILSASSYVMVDPNTHNSIVFVISVEDVAIQCRFRI